jgi:hypothetical protein
MPGLAVGYAIRRAAGFHGIPSFYRTPLAGTRFMALPLARA